MNRTLKAIGLAIFGNLMLLQACALVPEVPGALGVCLPGIQDCQDTIVEDPCLPDEPDCEDTLGGDADGGDI